MAMRMAWLIHVRRDLMVGIKGKTGEQNGERNDILKSETKHPCGFQEV